MKQSITILILLVLIIVGFYLISHHRDIGIIDKKETSEIMEIESSIKLFYLHTGRYPTEEEGLRVLMIPPEDNKAKWKGPYIEKPYTDRWNKPYVYTTSVVIDNESFKVYSFGENGIDEKCKGDDVFVLHK